MQTRNDTQKLSLINGRIHTPTSTASCITFEHGRIVSIGDEAAALNGKVIDLQGKTVLPAFCDTSLDFFAWAEDQERLNLSTVHSQQEFTGALTAYQQDNPEPLRGWYVAQGLPDSLNISRDDIDAVIPSRPCAIIDAKRTHAVLNTPAMSEFNMPQDNIELDGLEQHLPPLSTNDIHYLIRTYSPKLNALGIAEVWVNAYTDHGKLWDIFSSEAYGSLSFRARLNFGFDDVVSMNEFLASGLRTGDGFPKCRFGGIIVRDDQKQEEQKNMITSAHLSGCQVIADNSQYSINVMERIIKKFPKTPRHLIRSSSFNSKLIDRMKILELGGISLSSNEDNELHSAFMNGIVVSAGSGQMLVSPLKNIGVMVAGGLSIAEALSVYSWSASWNGRTEMRRGELAIGNDADVAVTEMDPFSVKPEEIAGIDAAMTFCAGVKVYDKNDS